MAKQTKKQAVEQRTQQRLAARKEATQKGVETRRRNREAQGKPQSAKAQEPAPGAAQAAEAQQGQAQVADGRTKRPERPGAQDKRAGGAMATVALRGEQAERFRALAAKHELTLAKLLVRMMEVFEAAAK
jgi:D-alanyl-D-alanine carboxypeptidase